MRNNLLKKVLLSVCSFLAVSCVAVGGMALSSTQNVYALEQTDIVTAVEGYTSILPAGVTLGEYTVLDLDAKTFSTGINVQGDMGTHQAVRFQYNKTNGPWALYLGLYNDTNGYHKPYNSGYFALWNGSGNTLSSVIFAQTVTGSMPSWMERADKGNYDIEYGGIKCYNSNGGYAGEYYYLEVDGCIISEYFHESDNAAALATNLYTISGNNSPAVDVKIEGTKSDDPYIKTTLILHVNVN